MSDDQLEESFDYDAVREGVPPPPKDLTWYSMDRWDELRAAAENSRRVVGEEQQ